LAEKFFLKNLSCIVSECKKILCNINNLAIF